MYYLSVLGSPRITHQDADSNIEVRFRYRDTWVLLASLVLEPITNRREALILRLALDGEQTGRDKLRFRLNDLRHGAPSRRKNSQVFCGVGAESVLADTEIAALHRGLVRSDFQDVEAALGLAAELATPEQKVTCLREAALLLRGGFLEGHELPGEGDGWLERMRFEAERLSAEVWLQLAQTLDATGERRGAFDAARKAYMLRPEHPEILELLLDLSDGAREQEEVLQLSKRLGVEKLLPCLEELEREGLSLTITEECVLREAIQTRLAQLSQEVARGLKAISGFPQAFTASQALAICDLSVETLERITRAFPLRKDEGRYVLLPAMRAIFQSTLSEQERQQFQERNSLYWCHAISYPVTYDFQKVTWEEDKESLKLAVNWYLKHAPRHEGVTFLHHYWHSHNNFISESEVKQSEAYLRRAMEELPRDTAQKAIELLGRIAVYRQDFVRSIYWLRMAIERFGSVSGNSWLQLLMASHHAQQDEIFDETLLCLSHLEVPWERVQWHFHIAENRMARSRFTEALEHNDIAFTMQTTLEGIKFTDDTLPVLWGQRGSILLGLNRGEEAERCWDQALLGYEVRQNRGGVAECYQALGKLAAQSGRVGLGISLVQQAIATFVEVGNEGAVAAAMGTLGDILRTRGEIEEARSLYEKGLAFWKEREHPRWIEIFEARLAKSEVVSGTL